MKNIDSQLKIIRQGTAEIIQEAELVEKLKLKKKLTVKVGLDPTMPDMHLGHTVVINKLRQFQDLGHRYFPHRRLYCLYWRPIWS